MCFGILCYECLVYVWVISLKIVSAKCSTVTAEGSELSAQVLLPIKKKQFFNLMGYKVSITV